MATFLGTPAAASRDTARRMFGGREEKVARGLGWFSIGLGLAELIAPGAIARVVGSRNHSSLLRAYGAREMAAGVGILASSDPTPWLWARAAGDMIDLASLGAVAGSGTNHLGKTIFSIASVAGVTVLDICCATACQRAEES